MDKQTLVAQAIEKLKQDLRSQGYTVEEHRVIPTYVGYRLYPIRLGLVMPNASWPSVLQKVHYLGERERTVLTEEERALIGTILTYPSAEAMNEDMDERLGLTTVVSDW